MYSPDFRRLAIRLFKRDKLSYWRVAKLLNISSSTVHRWVASNGVPCKRRKMRRLTASAIQSLSELLLATPVTTLKLLQQKLHEAGIGIGVKAVSRAVKDAGFSRKRTTKRSGPLRPADPPVAFERELHQRLEQNATVVSVDECFFAERVLPLYGYAPRGNKCIVKRPTSSWVKRSLLLAVASDGTKHFRILRGSVDRNRFSAFIMSLPYAPGTTVILDNASIHKSPTPFVAKRYDALFAPPYSPDHNSPVENFAVVKHAFRRDWPWHHRTVDESIAAAADGLCPDSIVACFANLQRRVARTA
jgi:transposase